MLFETKCGIIVCAVNFEPYRLRVFTDDKGLEELLTDGQVSTIRNTFPDKGEPVDRALMLRRLVTRQPSLSREIGARGRGRGRIDLIKACTLVGIESAVVKYQTLPEIWQTLKGWLTLHPEKYAVRPKGVGIPDCMDCETKTRNDVFDANQLLFAIERENRGRGRLKVMWFPTKKAEENWHLACGNAVLYPSVIDFMCSTNAQEIS